MRLLKYIFLVSILATTTSCRKYLDIIPKGKIIPEKTNDYRLLLDQISNSGKSRGFVNTYSNDLLMGDDLGINSFSSGFYGPTEQNVLMFAEHIYQDFESDPDWEAMYNQIYITNLVVSDVMDSKGGSLVEKKKLLAEARVHRAFAYLTLVNLYAPHFNPTSADSDLGVPIREGLDFEEALPRATVRKVYDYILNDLSLAAQDLPLAPELNFNNRPTAASAYALWARVYLYLNDADNARRYADSSLKYYDELLDYNTLGQGTAIPGTLNVPTGLINKEVTLLKSTTSGVSLFYASPELVALYDQTNDLRMQANFFPDALFGMSFGYISTEWSGRTPIKGTSVPETYLTRAEAYARLGEIGKAIDDINLIRKNRYRTGTNYVVDASTQGEALALVKEERRRELAFRGSRWFDIRRYNRFDGDAIYITHTINGTPYTLAPNTPRAVLPIGRKYIDLNPEIKQNQR